MRSFEQAIILGSLAAVVGSPSSEPAKQRAAPPKSALFQIEISAAELMRKTSGEMTYDPAYDGPTLLCWKCAHELKLGNASRDLFRPSHNEPFTVKRRTIDLDRFPALKSLMPIGPPAYLMTARSAKPSLDLFVIRPAKPFRVTGIDAAGKRRSASLREICIPANSRTLFLYNSVAGPDFVRRFDPGVSNSPSLRGVLWDRHRVNLQQTAPRK